MRELVGPASVGMMVATSAYMVHGLFPVLATQYAGLSEAEAGLIYSFSAAFFLVGGPLFGWLIDRYGRIFGIAWRSAATSAHPSCMSLSRTLSGWWRPVLSTTPGKAPFVRLGP